MIYLGNVSKVENNDYLFTKAYFYESHSFNTLLNRIESVTPVTRYSAYQDTGIYATLLKVNHIREFIGQIKYTLFFFSCESLRVNLSNWTISTYTDI